MPVVTWHASKLLRGLRRLQCLASWLTSNPAHSNPQVSKLSCVRTGYWQDPYLQHFVRKPSRRSPMINRGYYSRCAMFHVDMPCAFAIWL